MTTAFFDSSALVKLYADEPGSTTVRSLSPIAVSQIARVEVPAAIWRKHRIGEIPAAVAGVLVADFEADFYGTNEDPERFAVVQVNAAILDTAARFSGSHGLRAYDAVQLASVAALRDSLPSPVLFAAFDGGLNSAAAAEGLIVLDI